MRTTLLVPIVILTGAAGCVTTATHQAALDRARKCNGLRDSENRRHAAEVKRLKADLEAVNRQLEISQRQAAADSKATRAELEELRRQREETAQRLAEYKKLTSRFRKMIDAGKIKVYFRRGRMMVALPSAVLFPSGKAELSERGKQALTAVAETLKEFRKRRFIVAGHTDNVPIKPGDRTEFKDNWELSTARALMVTRFLIEKGLSPRNLAAAGHSKFDPVRSNRTRRGRRRNRRIELMLVPEIPPLPKVPDGSE
jgi:chemotaxis protein MotB